MEMKNHIIGVFCYCTAVFFSILISGTACSQNDMKKGDVSYKEKMMNQSVYPVYYATPRRDSAVPIKTDAKGRVAWSSPLKVENPEMLKALLFLEDHIVVDTFPKVTVFSPEGKETWTRSKQFGSFVAVGNGMLYYETEEIYLSAVNTNKETVLESAPLPGVMSNEFHLTLFWPRPHDFIVVAFFPGKRPEQEPEVAWRRAMYGERMGEEGGGYPKRQRLFPLFLPEQEVLMLGVDVIISLDIENGEEKATFQYPLAEIIDWSANAEGTIFIAGYEEKNKAIVAMSSTGEEQWKWVDPYWDDRWISNQPPIRFGEQGVYVFTNKRIVAVRQGSLFWHYEVKDGLVRHGTSLADKSLLATAGKTLFHLNSAGKVLFTVSLEDEILAPPIVDAKGNIYVVTNRHLVKVE